MQLSLKASDSEQTCYFLVNGAFLHMDTPTAQPFPHFTSPSRHDNDLHDPMLLVKNINLADYTQKSKVSNLRERGGGEGGEGKERRKGGTLYFCRHRRDLLSSSLLE